MYRSRLVFTIGLMVSCWTAASPAAARVVGVPKGEAKPRILAFELAEVSDGAAGAVQAADPQPLVLLSDQEIARGRTSAASVAGTAEAVVYANTVDQGNWTVRGQRFSFTPTMSSTVVNSAGFSIPTNVGTFIADDMTLGGGWKLGGQISSFSAFVRRSGTDQTRFIGDGTARATVTLWDGDPINLIDTTGDGFASAPIPGASCDFTLSPDVPFSTLQNLKCNLATPITPAHDNVWMVLTSDSCRLFWPITLLRASVGTSRDRGILGQDDDAGTLGSLNGPSTAATDGACCNDGGGTACGPAAVLTDCTGDASNLGGRCSDGDAETHLNFSFGGPCIGDAATDSCVNYLAEIKSPARVNLSIVPAGTGPHGALVSGVVIRGNEILLPHGGFRVFLDVRLSNWDPDHTGVTLESWQLYQFDLGFASGLQGTLTRSGTTACPNGPQCRGGPNAGLPCVDSHECPLSFCDYNSASAECNAAFGANCMLTGAPCVVDGDCPDPSDTCGGGVPCSFPPGMGGFCAPVFVSRNRTDFVYHGLLVAGAVDLTNPGIRVGFAVNGSPSATAPVPFPADGLYLATIVLDVPVDALGTFTIDLGGKDGGAVLIDDNRQFIPLVGFVPAKITIGTDPLLKVAKNRYLTIIAGKPGVSQAIRVKFVDLPAPFDVLNGSSRWVGSPFDISENGHSRGPGIPGFADFKAASLGCDPFFMDWSTIGGVVQVLHEDIVPGATYEITVFNEGALTTAVSTSTVSMAKWGDLVGPFDAVNGVWSAPDGSVDVALDVVAMIESFQSEPTSARKVRIDVDPGTPDGGIDIVDIVRVLDAFRGLPYPFAPTIPPCGP